MQEAILSRYRFVEVLQTVTDGDLKWITITVKLRLDEAEALYLPESPSVEPTGERILSVAC